MTYSLGRHTASVGTDIVAVCPARDTDIPVLTSVTVTTGAAEQTLYVCIPMGLTENTTFLTAGSTTVTVTDIAPLKYAGGDSKTINADSRIVALSQFGTYEVLKVASVSGNDITFSTGPSYDMPVRSIMYVMYDPTEEIIALPSPIATTMHPSFRMPASATTTLSLSMQGGVKTGGGVFALAEGTPMMLYLTNDFAQAAIESAEFDFVDRSEELAIAFYGEENVRSGVLAPVEEDPSP